MLVFKYQWEGRKKSKITKTQDQNLSHILSVDASCCLVWLTAQGFSYRVWGLFSSCSATTVLTDFPLPDLPHALPKLYAEDRA